MSYPYVKGRPDRPDPQAGDKLPLARFQRLEDPAGYIFSEGLLDAVNVAIVLGQPLLLTGEPGTGKTLLAYAVGEELCLQTHKFETKSTSSARDLFYIYDTVGRFQAAQLGEKKRRAVDYITYNALGKAILLAMKPEEIRPWLPDDFQYSHNGRQPPCRSVVLIDEIDKAPRDFPNDILNEIENMYFKVPELDNREFKAGPGMRPLVMITSNSEKHLPDAFLRRCVFYNIEFPDKDQMEKIVKKRFGDYIENSTDFLNKALELFEKLRDPNTGLKKNPATAELLGWIIALKETYLKDKDFTNKATPIHKDNEPGLLKKLTVLIKNSEDLDQARKVLNKWLKNS